MKATLACFVLFLFLYVATAGGHLYSPDEELMFRTCESLSARLRLDVEPMGGFATMRGRGGLQYAQYGVGQVVAAAPFYWLGRALEKMLPANVLKRVARPTVIYHGGSPVEWARRLGVSFFGAFVGALTVALLFNIALGLTASRAAAWWTAAVYGAGTLAWPHSKTFFSEPLATLCLLATLAALVKARCSTRPNLWWATAGAAAGYAVFTRLDSAVPLLGLAVFAILELIEVEPVKERAENANADDDSIILNQVRLSKSFAVRLFPAIAIGLVFLFLILVMNNLRFGRFLTTGYGDQPEGLNFGTPLPAGLYGLLFSVGKGLFFFSPPLVLSLFAFGSFFRADWRLATGVCILLLATLIFHAQWINWAGGWCWGPRHIFAMHVFLALPIAFWVKERYGPVCRICLTVFLTTG
ncbi:MAG: phospholipid carrier-dependent glycosyltransferase, partial [bacterium]